MQRHPSFTICITNSEDSRLIVSIAPYTSCYASLPSRGLTSYTRQGSTIMISSTRSRYASFVPSVFSSSTRNSTVSFENCVMFFSFSDYRSSSPHAPTSRIHATQYSR